MTTNIIVTFKVEGVHSWTDCPHEEVDYLKNQHRHLFWITAKKEVSHDDRDIEIIMFKRSMETWLSRADRKPVDFKNKSCEMIARSYMEKFGLCYCRVLEDGENGAEVWGNLIPQKEHPYTKFNEDDINEALKVEKSDFISLDELFKNNP